MIRVEFTWLKKFFFKKMFLKIGEKSLGIIAKRSIGRWVNSESEPDCRNIFGLFIFFSRERRDVFFRSTAVAILIGIFHRQVLYAWARDAPMLTLPPDVGFQVGQGTAIKYLVLQVHYASITKFAGTARPPPRLFALTGFPVSDGSSDNSGIFLHYTDKPKEKLAGVVLLGTGGVISPHSQTNMETECRIRENKIIYPFAYRTHTHSLGNDWSFCLFFFFVYIGFFFF